MSITTTARTSMWDEYDDESVVRMAEQLRKGVSIATPVFDGVRVNQT